MQDYISINTDINGPIPTVTVKQYDSNSRFLHVTLTDGDLPEEYQEIFEMENCVARLLVELGDGEYAYIDGEIADPENGIATFLLPGSVTQTPGTYTCEIRITEPESAALISTKAFTLTVEESLAADDAIEATPQYSALENALMRADLLFGRMNAIETRIDNLVAAGDVQPGTVAAEVADAREGWDGTIHNSLRAAVVGQANGSLSYLGTLLNAATWENYSSSFDGLPTNIFTVCNLDNSAGVISDAPIRGQLTGTIVTLGRENKTRRSNYDTQIFLPQDCERIYLRKYMNNEWSAWKTVGGTYLKDELDSFADSVTDRIEEMPQYRADINAEYAAYDNQIVNVTDDGVFFVSSTPGENNDVRWNDLPTDNQNFIVSNSRYSANWILQTAIPTNSLGTVYNRLIPRPGLSGTPRDWTCVGGIDSRLKVLAVGDSICRGWRNGGKGFVGDLGLTYVNEGVSGATLSTDRADVTNIPTQLANYKSNYPNYKPDIIIANGGHNDYDRNVLLGDIPTRPATSVSALNMSTVMGGLQKLFLTMIQEYPTAERFFVTTHKIKKNGVYLVTENNTAGYNEADLHDAIVACCNVYNVKIIDVFNDSPINSFFPEYVSNINYTYNPTPTDSTGWAEAVANTTDYINADGVHPLSRGYLEGYVPLILAALRGNTSGTVSRTYLTHNEIAEVLTD